MPDDPPVPSLTADILIAELDRRLAEGRLSISAHEREVRDVRRAERFGQKLPALPRHDSPKWMVKADQDSADKKAAKAVREEHKSRAAAINPVPGGAEPATAEHLAERLKALQNLHNAGLLRTKGLRSQTEAAQAAFDQRRPLPEMWRDRKPKGTGFWSIFDNISNNA